MHHDILPSNRAWAAFAFLCAPIASLGRLQTDRRHVGVVSWGFVCGKYDCMRTIGQEFRIHATNRSDSVRAMLTLTVLRCQVNYAIYPE